MCGLVMRTRACRRTAADSLPNQLVGFTLPNRTAECTAAGHSGNFMQALLTALTLCPAHINDLFWQLPALHTCIAVEWAVDAGRIEED